MSNTELQERVAQLERALSDLIYSLNFRRKVDKDAARNEALKVLEGVRNG